MAIVGISIHFHPFSASSSQGTVCEAFTPPPVGIVKIRPSDRQRIVYSSVCLCIEASRPDSFPRGVSVTRISELRTLLPGHEYLDHG
jgi:hypothetical protein